MNSMLRLAATFAAGAAAMYYLDPVAGRRRRALARDRTTAACHDAEHYARGKLRRAADRAQGVVAETRSRVAAQPVDDSRLHERVRAKLGHLVERPAAIDVAVEDGNVVLAGEALEQELQALPAAVSRLQGVASVESRLTARPAHEVRQPQSASPPSEATPQQPH